MKCKLLVGLYLAAICACAGTGGYVKLDSTVGMDGYEGKRIELIGRLSETPWQHLISNPEGYDFSYYFDVAESQIVIYTMTPLDCRGRLIVRGTVVKVQGSSKRPGSKADGSYVEFHLAVDQWECR
jgi:hypothetical protein